MSAINNCTFVGRLTKDPQAGTTQSGINWARFTVAVSEKAKDTEKQIFVNCSCWRGNAEFVTKYFHKGDPIAVSGAMWQTKKDDAVYIDLETESVKFVPGKRAVESESGKPAGNYTAVDDALPF